MICTARREAATRFWRTLRVYPTRFWLLVAATFVFLAAMGVAFPYTTLFLRERFEVSMAVVGLIMGGAALAGLPLQVVGGHVSDRYGRRPVLIASALATIALYVGLAFVDHLWQAALLVFCERSLGWPMFLQGSNAMIADLVRDRRRAEAFGFSRLATMAGVVVGPALAGVALGAGATYEQLFVAAGIGCGAFLVAVVAVLGETRPVEPARPALGGLTPDAPAPPAAPAVPGSPAVAGYREVLGDRRFLAFCAVALLPLFCYGQVYSTLPVLLTGTLGLSAAGWGALLSFNAAVVVLLQFPAMRVVRRFERVGVLAAASVFFALGIGGAAFVSVGWSLVAVVLFLSVGEVLFAPVSSTVVASLAAPAVRGRYIGVWTLVWTFGMALGPTLGGTMMTVLGPQGSFALVLVAGLAGGLGFALLRPARGGLVLGFRRAKR